MKTALIILAVAVLVLFILATWDVLFQIHTYFSAPKKSAEFREAQESLFQWIMTKKHWIAGLIVLYIVFRTILDKNHEWKKRF